MIESVHEGSVVVTDPRGAVVLSVGEPDALFYPRSTLKPLQAIGLIESGLRLSDDLLALAAASHSGGPEHVEGVRRILADHNVDEQQLANPADLPIGEDERAAWLRAGGVPSQLTQNCSGQHAAMLATCTINGWPLDDYLDPQHPLQVACRDAVQRATDELIAVETTDACGTPLYAVTMTSMARAFGNLARKEAEQRTDPGGQVADAMRRYPEIVAGHGRDVTVAMRAQPGLLAKEGAEGVQLFGLPDGTGVAVKIGDGAGRARMPVAVSALAAVTEISDALRRMLTVPVLGGDREVGSIQATTFAVAAGH